MRSVKEKEVKMYTVPIRHDVKNSDGSSHHGWIVPVQFNRLPFIDGPQFVEDERTPQTV